MVHFGSNPIALGINGQCYNKIRNATIACKIQQSERNEDKAKTGFAVYPKKNGVSSERILHFATPRKQHLVLVQDLLVQDRERRPREDVTRLNSTKGRGVRAAHFIYTWKWPSRSQDSCYFIHVYVMGSFPILFLIPKHGPSPKLRWQLGFTAKRWSNNIYLRGKK